MVWYSYTYRSGDEKTREEVPETDEERHDDGGNLVVGSESHTHHAIESEVDKAHEDEKVEPQELLHCSFEPYHCVQDCRISQGLDPNINDLYCYLHHTTLCEF